MPRLLSNTFLIWSPDSPRRVWGLDYSIVYSYLGICHVFVMRCSRSLRIILQQFSTLTKLPPSFQFFDSNFGARYEPARLGARLQTVGCVTA